MTTLQSLPVAWNLDTSTIEWYFGYTINCGLPAHGYSCFGVCQREEDSGRHIFDGKKLIALEVETEKRWKPSHASSEDRLSRLNSKCCFFNETKVVFPALGDSLDSIGPSLLANLGFKKD